MSEIKKITLRELIITILIAIYNLSIMFFTLLWIFTNVFKYNKSKLGNLELFDVNENVTYGLFLSGMLGGTFYCLRSLYQRLGETFTPIKAQKEGESNSLNMTTWFFWYFYRPIQGGVLSLILLVLTKSSLLKIGTSEDVNIDSYYTLIGFGFLAGFGAHELIHKIEEIIRVIFAKAKTSGSNSNDKTLENKQ